MTTSNTPLAEPSRVQEEDSQRGAATRLILMLAENSPDMIPSVLRGMAMARDYENLEIALQSGVAARASLTDEPNRLSCTMMFAALLPLLVLDPGPQSRATIDRWRAALHGITPATIQRMLTRSDNVLVVGGLIELGADPNGPHGGAKSSTYTTISNGIVDPPKGHPTPGYLAMLDRLMARDELPLARTTRSNEADPYGPHNSFFTLLLQPARSYAGGNFRVTNYLSTKELPHSWRAELGRTLAYCAQQGGDEFNISGNSGVRLFALADLEIGDIWKKLLSPGAPGNTLLHIFASKYQPSTAWPAPEISLMTMALQSILKTGIHSNELHVNTRLDYDNQTIAFSGPLLQACVAHGNSTMMRFLLEAGADPSLRTGSAEQQSTSPLDGKDAYQIAAWRVQTHGDVEPEVTLRAWRARQTMYRARGEATAPVTP
jgi:hypothetical protein